jgi:hypothetical protein
MVTIDNSKYNEAGEDVAVLVWETSSLYTAIDMRD